MAKNISIPLIGRFLGGKERQVSGSEINVNVSPFSTRPLDDVHRQAVVAIWAIGKTDLDVVRARIEEQFMGLTQKEVDLMIGDVKKIRKKGAL